ncbi:hypothetical protein [Streptomyces pristinaespiralis]|uniref:hypothetical protein n=1 Tax=Streptomyces pristinaespiralis TaxID=38300 RepID=UPI0033FCA1AF
MDKLNNVSLAVPREDLDRLLQLQQRIDEHLLPLAEQSAQVHKPRDRHFFLDLVAAVQLIKFSWPLASDLVGSSALAAFIDSHAAVVTAELARSPGPGTRLSRPWSPPDDPSQCAALLLAAHELLESHPGDQDALRERVQPLAVASFDRMPAHMASAFRRLDFSRGFARALARRVNGFHPAGGHQQPALRVPSRPCRFGAEHVPSFLPSSCFEAYFTGLVERMGPLTAWTIRHLRRAASLKLVEMAVGGTWPQCANILEIPRISAQHTLATLERQLAPADARKLFDQAVQRVARALDSDSQRVDYAQRRRLLSSWRMPKADWKRLCQGLGRLGNGPLSPSPEAATALVWAKVTEGDYLHSPVHNALREAGQSRTHMVAAVNQMRVAAKRNGEKSLLLRRLDDYATCLALACDQPQETLTTR